MGICCSTAREQNTKLSDIPLASDISGTGDYPIPKIQFKALKNFYEQNSNFINRKLKRLFQGIIEDGDISVTQINLNFTPLGKLGGYQLSMIIGHFTQLQTLKCWKAQLGSMGIEYVSPCFKFLPNLLILSLEDNDIRKEGAIMLSQNLAALVSLQKLYLHINYIGDEGVLALTPAIANLKQLTNLTLDENMISPVGLESLSFGIDQLPKLENFGISSNMINDSSYDIIQHMTKQCKSLACLNLSSNPIENPERFKELHACITYND